MLMLLHHLLTLILFLHVSEGDVTPRSMCDAWNTIIQNSDSTNHTSAVTAARRVINYVRPGSTVIDVGGHLGIFTQSMLDPTLLSDTGDRRNSLPGLVVIFEPVRFLHLCQIQRLGSTDAARSIRFYNVALGNDDHTLMDIVVAPYEPDPDSTPSGWNTLLAGDPTLLGNEANLLTSSTATKETVVVRNLDRVLAELGTERERDVSVVKIDVEGFEGEVLRGALPWLQRMAATNGSLPVFVVEVGWGTLLHPHAVRNGRTYRAMEEIGCVCWMFSFSFSLLLLLPPWCFAH